MVESICSLHAICSGSSLNSQVVRDSQVNGREQPDSTVRSEERQGAVPTSDNSTLRPGWYEVRACRKRCVQLQFKVALR